MPSKWHSLNLSQEDLPPLLFQYNATRQGYQIYVTDLTSIWSERLSRGDILSRADETATTIDPSEDQGQLEVLLAKIGEALRGDGGNAGLSSGPHADSLELTTSTKLPAPLKPLRWSLNLAKEGSSSLTDKILLPLLREEVGWESRQRFLLDQLKQKDWILGKLFDKVEALGVDLGTVFPGAARLRSARKGSSRSEAAKLIKGVAPFDEPAWLAEYESSDENLGLAANLVQEAFGSNGSQNVKGSHPAPDKWWDVLQLRPETATRERRELTPPEKTQTKPSNPLAKPSQEDLDKDIDSSTESEDDEFQRQETPPRFKIQKPEAAISAPRPSIKKTPSPQPLVLDAGEATASESEAEPEPEPAPRPEHVPPPKPQTPPPQPKEAPKKPKGGLGVIGGKKKKEEKEQLHEPSPQPTEPPQEHRKPTGAQERAASPPKTSPAKPKRPTKLGMIGGKTKAKDKATEPSETSQAGPTDSSKEAHIVPSSEKGRPVLETMDTPLSPEAKVSLRSPAPVEPVSAAPPETEEERANRKREELKRHLEAQSKAPAKKKRRF